MKLFVLLTSLFVSINSQYQCGTTFSNFIELSNRVFNGELARDGQWPWAAALYLTTGKVREFFCSGTLVSDQFVLTAAHCIQDKGLSRAETNRISITLGTADSSNYKGIIRRAIEAKTHPDWSDVYGTPYDADLAVIKLDRPVRFSCKILPICLPKAYEKVFEVSGFVAGFGKSNDDVLDGKLRYLEMPTVTQENCLWHPSGFSTVASNRTFCGGDLTKSACRGDSGAGFVIKSHTKSYKIIGIVSASLLGRDEYCRPDSYVVFTSVPLFVDWILKEIGREKEISNEVWNIYDQSTGNIPPNSVFLYEGTTKSYVARLMFDGKLIIGKFVPQWNSIYVPYNRAELQFYDGIEILATDKNHEWIPFNGTFPSNAVQGGYEGTAKLFVGRKMINENQIIGKIVDLFKKIYVPYFSKEHEFADNFDILVLGEEN